MEEIQKAVDLVKRIEAVEDGYHLMRGYIAGMHKMYYLGDIPEPIRSIVFGKPEPVTVSGPIRGPVTFSSAPAPDPNKGEI